MVSTPENKNYKVIGTRPIRHDGYDKVTAELSMAQILNCQVC